MPRGRKLPGKDTRYPFHFPSETSDTMELLTLKPALILEKRALLFPDNSLVCPVLLSGFESELKMAANSTYWEAKVRIDRLG